MMPNLLLYLAAFHIDKKGEKQKSPGDGRGFPSGLAATKKSDEEKKRRSLENV